MSEADLAARAGVLLGGVFALAFVFGAVAQRSNFCTMGGIADCASFGDATRLRQWLLAIAVAIVGTNVLAAAGVIDTAASFYTAPRLLWLSNLLGGLLFGFGMVLAGGCGSRNLIRLGAGSLKALVVVIVLGLVAFITLRGLLGVLRVGILEPTALALASPQDLPSLAAGAGIGKPALQLVLGLAIGGALALYVFRDRAFLSFDNLLAGGVIGAVIVAVWALSATVGFVAEHPQTLEASYLRTNSGRMESLSFVAPVAYTLDYLMFFSDTSKRLTLGIVAVAGTVAGAAAHALATGRFRWEGFSSTEDTANHVAGAALMGFGGVTALGCTVGQGLSGVSTLALGSFIALAAIVAGALLGLRYLAWRTDATA